MTNNDKKMIEKMMKNCADVTDTFGNLFNFAEYVKITFEVPGTMGVEDTKLFAKRIKNTYKVKILCNISSIIGSDTIINGMTAEGSSEDVSKFILEELGDIHWLRIV